jgi:hypothetical protein
MWAEAHRLADTGDCFSAFYVEAQLRSLGFQDVDKISKNKWARDELTQRCLRAVKDKTNATRT